MPTEIIYPSGSNAYWNHLNERMTIAAENYVQNLLFN